MSNDRVNASCQRRTVVGWKLDEAYYQAKGSDSGQGLKQANALLQEALAMMKDKSEKMIHEDHEACWQRWLEIKETIKWKRKEICDFNYGKFKPRLAKPRVGQRICRKTQNRRFAKFSKP
jgi:hypothetical protein